MSAEIFQQQILNWFDLNGRKDLPWQQQITPYKTWLSEVMLQQTQVVTVIPYFNKFLLQFPDVEALASAPIDSVLQRWAGLGYYARARNLHKTACIISANGGSFPNNLESLMQLPGIGRSTAGAILSIAFNNSHPILDGNVRRVLARHQAISGWTGQTKISNQLWQISSHYTPIKRCADYTQAMMDLGATLCTRSKPKCEQCPINLSCLAKIEDRVSEFPTPKPKKTIPIKQILFLILQNEQSLYLLEKRPPTGIWGGLWSFPEFNSLAEIKAWCLEKKLPIFSIQQLAEQRHTFSHYHLDYTPFIVKTQNPINNVMEANQSVWYKSEQINTLGLPAPIKQLLQNHFKGDHHDKNG
ncbi:MAG: A/G-specific adenine glycosylase [Methylococcales bacterium]|nr:A/G-specific adenine glycosylase [Methylococcales bacterium]